MDVEATHLEIVDALKRAGTPYPTGGSDNDSYSGSNHPFFFVSVPERRSIIGWVVRANKSASDAELLGLADRLFRGVSHEEKTLGAILLERSAPARRLATLPMLDAWLGELNGWAEIDSLCSGVFKPDEIAAAWPAWKAFLQRLAGDANINKRRASLVLLTAAARSTDDPRFRDLAFELVERLKGERHIMITKAVSWLLRSMAGQHGPAVAAYLEANAASLPAIAVRETRVKLATGTKSGRSRRVGDGGRNAG
ncbi:MAG TPA: DNA alkylation repair protein [Caulobacteraceae bacterium]|jgi:3-methyladenine DNA glycosylase AlkD